MIIGVVKEIKNHEYRVGLTPLASKAYVSAGHRVLMQKGAGEGAGFEDAEYISAGAEIISEAADVWKNSEMIIKVKEPIEPEYGFLREGLILYTYLHLAADKPLTEALLSSGMKAVAYETIEDRNGGLPCLTPMSEVAGRMSVLKGAKYLEKTFGGEGVLLSGVPGVPPAKVAVLGGGVVGTNAAKTAAGLGADVTVFDTNLSRLAYLDDIMGGRIKTRYSSRGELEEYLKEADLIIGAVLLRGYAAPKLVLKSDLKHMKKGAVIVDVAVDQGGCFETTHATTHQDPVFIEDGVIHYCVANMPGAVPRTSAIALGNATLGYGLKIASMGLEEAMKADKGLALGLNCYKGKVTCIGVAETFGLEYTPAEKVLCVL
ncbi:MAG: alanine dehydrogenase [Defluviitaleaceae bacterium]|nr:alanine dehydrogenase [Defluviitaleaceae bacterium]